jgi:TIR domain-containing protein
MSSHRVALLLKDFIPKVIQRTNCFVSSADIQAGEMWQKILFEELENRNIGLVCVTRANLESRWLNFEAGAIAKKVVETAKLCPVLIDLPKSDLPLPLSSFQMKLLEKNDVLAICEMINANGDQPLSEKGLHHAFRVQWQEFEKAFSEAKRREQTRKKRRDQTENCWRKS